MGDISPLAQNRHDEIDAGVQRLFADEQAPMVRMATLMVGSAAVAEEIVQDAFLRVTDRWASLERPGAYLRQTVVNGCAQVLRRRSVEGRYAGLELVPAPAELPAHLVELRDALDRLSERQRLAVVLRYFVDIGDKDIAELMGVRPSTVRSLVRRALAALHKELT